MLCPRVDANHPLSVCCMTMPKNGKGKSNLAQCLNIIVPPPIFSRIHLRWSVNYNTNLRKRKRHNLSWRNRELLRIRLFWTKRRSVIEVLLNLFILLVCCNRRIVFCIYHRKSPINWHKPCIKLVILPI